ncbi:TlpA family protein disulfide reductase [Baekduia soli]|uniref:TlpA family protein disulfide reductase n=1 Tax=Baekduia soli TaxID=496014 RepID=A0A5B8U2M6_9ACTN|nr:TlpA disulfide reductase family protein [Baekduia soli]QEC47266.1 TlpA family protein disulfide reductase [Baekduia soli]
MGTSRVTVLYELADPVQAAAVADGDRLWLAPGDLAAATGWSLEPEGLCHGQACVPLPADGSWRDAAGRVDLTAFAARLGRPVACDEQHAIWAFGAPARDDAAGPPSAQAPDFTLPDLHGTLHALSDHRGTKVLLLAWGSYCGCSLDLPVWRVLHEELRPLGLQIVAVAMDAGGAAAVRASVRPTPDELAGRDEILRRMTGWSEDLWNAKAAPTYPCLIDEAHVLGPLYGIVNVPTAVWIDEEGTIVRPAEPAGHSDYMRRRDLETWAIPDEDVDRLVANHTVYVDAVRDWAARGADSPFALAPEEVCRRRRRPGEAESRAAAHARIGWYLFGAGDVEAAKGYYRAAADLHPGHWTYRRQGMVLDPDLIGALNTAPEYYRAREALGADLYYPTIDLPGIAPPPPWLRAEG